MSTKQPLSLYLHIPFCSVRCTYCAFNTYTDLNTLIPAYIEALCREIRFLGKMNPHPLVDTIFFGGGTPSLISPNDYVKIFEAIHDSFVLDVNTEISLESNPNDLNIEYLRQLRQIGFNRLSIGMQSASQHVLVLYDRQHDMDTVKRAVDYARKADYDNINLDVIFGAPNEGFNDWEQTVASVISLRPEHISMYGLELKGGTPLRIQVDEGALPQPDDDLFADMYEYATEQFIRVGYGQYEISNWCKEGRESRHNLKYWYNSPYAGLGAGAHGFAGGFRYSTITSPQRYVDALLKGENQQDLKFPLTPGVGKSSIVDEETDMSETIMMGLRLTRRGILLHEFYERFGKEFKDLFPQQLQRFAGLGLLEIDNERVRLTQAGYLLSNSVIREFI